MRRSELPIDAEPRADVVVLDTIGELAQLYQLATVAFVGGSLVETGGHNILEPAVFGRPIVFGPSMHNFAEIAREFLAHDAAVQVQSERELEQVLVSLLMDPVRRAGLGAAARALVEANRGAKDRTLDVIGAAAAAGPSGHHPPVPRGPLIGRGRDLSEPLYAHARSCPPPVLRGRGRNAAAGSAQRRSISVGNLSVGGSGKTPLVALHRAPAARGRATARDPQPRLRPRDRRPTASLVVSDGTRLSRRSRRAPATSR